MKKMSESGSSRFIPFKSKKPLMDSPRSKSKPGNPNSSSVTLPTPEKIFTRSRNRSVALSVKEIRQAAGSRRRSEDPVGRVSSAKSRLVFSTDDSSSSASKRRRTSKNYEKEQLPEKYETLGKFFDALDTSITLTKLRGSKPTFFNISAKIEQLTDRRFSYSHLAQLKHILPEAIQIKRVMIYDEFFCRMKPELHITLHADAVTFGDKKITLRKVFRERLAEFVKAHRQGDEVPEEALPEPFNRRKPMEFKSASSVMEEMASIPIAQLISSPIKVPVKTQANIASTPSKTTWSEINLAPNPVPSTPAKIESTRVAVVSTPPHFASTPARLFSTKRSSDDVSVDPPCRPSSLRPRSLNFDSYTEDKKAPDVATDNNRVLEVEDVSSDEDILSILPDKLRQSIKEQERKAISEAKRKRRMMACLPKLFDVIRSLIQSIRRWVITKEELVHKIIAAHLRIPDRKEIEEQLILLQELVPEWISEKRSLSGDLLLCINKLAFPQTIRSTLEEKVKEVMASPLS